MTLMHDLLATLPEGRVQSVIVGLHWTAVTVSTAGERRCGLASTLAATDRHGQGPAIPEAGRLTSLTGRELAHFVLSSSPPEVSIGMATINALLPREPQQWIDVNAGEVIAQHGAGKRVALVGHFPFVPEVRKRVGTLWVLELDPRQGDLPASAAVEVIPQADVVAITGTALLNRTFDGLMALRNPRALVLVLGPSTPLSPLLFQHGAHLISGAVVENIEAVVESVSQGASFRQVHHAGVRLVTMQQEANTIAQSQLAIEQQQVTELEARQADLQARLPAHSLSPALMAELDEIEEALETARARRDRLIEPNR